MCYLAFTDDHQSTAAVLCPAVQELPLLLREGEDSEYCCVATLLPLHSWAHLWVTERALKASALSAQGINILVAAAHSCTQLLPLLFCLTSFHLPVIAFRFVPDFQSFALVFFTFLWLFLPHLTFCLPHLSSSSPACWWTTSSRWGSCWRRCLSRWEQSRWALTDVPTNTHPAPFVCNYLPLIPKSLTFFISPCCHWFHRWGVSLWFRVKMMLKGKFAVFWAAFIEQDWKLLAFTVIFFIHKVF